MFSDPAVSSSLSSEDVLIEARSLGKCYQLYDKPAHRMMQSLMGGKRRFYREFWALRAVDFEVRRGETLGIVGRNGAGKSTLLQMIAGTLKPTEGHATTHGRVAALLELGSGFNPEFTGRENVYLNASILGLSRKEIDARIGDILDYADIGEFVDQPVRNYSTGMVMRLAFAVVVHVDAEILIVDEALAVGDAFFMQKCMRFLRDFQKRGTMLFVSHDGSAITGLCDRVVWLEHGAVQRIGPAREVMEAYIQASMVERQGVPSRATRTDSSIPTVSRSHQIDQRQELIDRTQLRNDIRIHPFQPDAEDFGQSKVKIVDLAIFGEHGRPVAMVVAGECVTLRIDLLAAEMVDNVITGFYVKNRTGQLMFGDNTALSHEGDFSLSEGESVRASFQFMMPRLIPGDYFIAAGVSEGTQEQHVVQHWMHEALRFTATGSSMVAGLIGIPMLDIRLEKTSHEE